MGYRSQDVSAFIEAGCDYQLIPAGPHRKTASNNPEPLEAVFNPREEVCDLPHVLLTQRVVPSGHSGIANTAANHVIGMPFGIVDGIENELRYGRIKPMLHRARLIVERAVTNGAIR
jgi:hypothetical protein